MKLYYRDRHSELYQGDALEYLRLAKSQKFDAIITDPPYSTGGAFRSDRVRDTQSKYLLDTRSSANPNKKKLYEGFSGDNRDQRSYLTWSTMWMDLARRQTVDGGILMVFTDWRQLPTTSDAVQCAGWIWRGLVVWDKTQAVRPHLGRPRSQCEFIVFATNGPRPTEGRTIPGCFTHRVDPREKRHLTGKPVALMRDLMGLLPERSRILDPFAGSASTLLAAEQLGHSSIGIELDSHWCEIAASRLGQLTLVAA